MSGDHVVPDLDWFLDVNDRRGFSGRCPFAGVRRCPRYYQSLSLLGAAGSTQIDAEEDERLKLYWEGSDLWPRTDEYATAVHRFSDKDGTRHTEHFVHFCPEVAFDRFGYFASDLFDFADEIDRGMAQKRLAEEGVSGSDWRWRWASLTPMHYGECPLYAPLVQGGAFQSTSEASEPEVALGPSWMQIRFKFSWRRLQAWGTRHWSRLKLRTGRH